MRRLGDLLIGSGRSLIAIALTSDTIEQGTSASSNPTVSHPRALVPTCALASKGAVEWILVLEAFRTRGGWAFHVALFRSRSRGLSWPQSRPASVARTKVTSVRWIGMHQPAFNLRVHQVPAYQNWSRPTAFLGMALAKRRHAAERPPDLRRQPVEFQKRVSQILNHGKG